jgi:importin subunit alpha-2
LSNLCRGRNPPVAFSKVEPALPILALLLDNEDEDILVNACGALSYFSDATNGKIQEIIESNVCPRLVELLKHSSLRVVQAALKIIGNIVTGDDAQTQVILDCNALECLLKLLHSTDKSIRKEICWTISNIAAGNRDQLQVIWLNKLFF